MKKMMPVWIVVLSSMLSLSGCLIEMEGEDIINEEYKEDTRAVPYVPAYLDWDSFTFKSLRGGEDLKIYRGTSEDDTVPIVTSKEGSDVLVVALYTTNCEVCKVQAPWFDKLASEFPEDWYRVDFAIVFLDLFENSADKNVPWIRNLHNVSAYTNVAEACAGGACKKVFMPLRTQPQAGGIYYVNKKDIRENSKGVEWNTSTNPEELYEATKTHMADYLGLTSVSFDAVVSEIENGGTQDENF